MLDDGLAPGSAASSSDRLLQPFRVDRWSGRKNSRFALENSFRAPGASAGVVKIITAGPVWRSLIEEWAGKALFRQKFFANLHSERVYTTFDLLPFRQRFIVIHYLE